MQRPRDRQPKKLPDRQLYNDVPLLVTRVTDEERLFLKEWCEKRHLGSNYILVSTTYWLRSKSHTYASSLMFPEAKRLYMILCIHLTLKHLGYEEIHKCNFMFDLLEVYPSITSEKHREMEWELFRHLNFDLGK